MATFAYTVRLTSDGEPGTGLGGKVVNDFVPRNHDGLPALPASHIKGLMRAAFVEIATSLGWDSQLENRVFGARDQACADETLF